MMAEPKGAKAPEKTVEGLRRVGVILYDTDPDQLACIACGQHWQATGLRGHWWHCPNGCSQ
jgi:hypothetical protein